MQLLDRLFAKLRMTQKGKYVSVKIQCTKIQLEASLQNICMETTLYD